MENTLTGLTQFVYDTVDVVSRELCGLIPAVYKNTKAEEVAKDQAVSYDIAPAPTNYDVTPSNAIPALDSTTVAAGTMTISKVRANKFHWTGEDELAIGRNVKEGIQNNKFAQAFRALANEIETDLAALYVNASRAYGIAGTTPFQTAGDFTDASEVLRILKDNGAPTSELQLVINTAAGAKILGKQSQAYMAGSGDPLRQGVLLDINGFKIRESSKIANATGGTGANYLVNNGANYAAAATTIAADTGAGTIVAGDVIGFNGDPDRKYVVKTALAAGSLVIQDPGLQTAILDNDNITVAGSYAANMAFSKSAIHLLSRLPKMPEGGDSADDIMIVQDPVSGLFFQIALYRAYRSVLIEVAIAWGVKAAKPEHIALLLG